MNTDTQMVLKFSSFIIIALCQTFLPLYPVCSAKLHSLCLKNRGHRLIVHAKKKHGVLRCVHEQCRTCYIWTVYFMYVTAGIVAISPWVSSSSAVYRCSRHCLSLYSRHWEKKKRRRGWQLWTQLWWTMWACICSVFFTTSVLWWCLPSQWTCPNHQT